ncbi:uncharacterized protein LOC101851472 [Aplysia californica]|uniref:Uncharacterized protein LOC101851472 n=1 Tax=Aplysia californica TaxID=6500 RepID=A0ABM0KBF6_APLCA|nr:uncharacterized protein LOC101851472 [Aplysia californica]
MPHRSREIKIVGAEMKKKSAKGAESFEVITQEDETVCLSDDLSTVHSQLEDRLASTDAHFPADRGEGEKCEIEKAEDTEKVTEKSQSHLDIGVAVTSGVTETLESHNPCVQASSTKALCTSSLELRDSLGKCSTGSSDEAESSEVKRDSTGGTAGADVERSADVAGSPRTSPSGVCTGEGHKRGEEEEVDEILTEQGLDSSDSSLKRYATRGVKLDFSAVNSGKLTLTRGKSKSSQNWKGKTAHGESVVRGARRQTSKTLSRRKKVLLTSSCASALCDAFDPMVKKSSDSASVYSSTSTKLTQMQPKFSTTSNDQVQISSKRSRKSIHTIGNKKVTISEGAQQSLNNLCENSSVDGNVVSKSMPYFPKVVTLDKSLRPGKRGKVLSHQTNILARSELTDSAVWEKDGEKGTLVESAQVCTCGSLVCSTLASAERAKSLQIGTDCEKTGLLPTTKMSDLYDVATTKNSKLCQVPFASPHFPKDRLVQSNESGERQCAMTDVQKDADVEDNQDNRTLPQTTEDSVACPQCRRAFLVQAQLDYHLSSCHMTPDQTPGLTCRLCGLVAQSHFEMVAHRAGHGPQEFSCRFCHKQFRSEAYLNIHISALHTKSQACTCWQCGKRFNHPRYLRSHAKRHTGEKHHVCKICGFRFFEAHALRRHEETHKHKTQRQYAYICSKCHAGYNNKTNFVDHMNKHTGEKPYACPQCDKRFAYRSMLSRHKVYAHSSARPFSCEFCAKSFRFNSSLAEHRVLHTGVSRNVCGSCQKAFGAKSSLRQHQKRCRFRELLISSQTNLGSDSTMSECGASLQSINHVYVENSLTACTLQRELMFGSAKENPCPSQLNEVIVPRDSGELLLQQREASAPQHSQVILPQQNEVILPQQREVILSQQNEVILPQQREVILPQQRVILPQQSGSVTEQTEVLIPQQNEVILPQQNRAILPQLNEVLVESNFEEATVSSKVVLPLQPSGTDRNVVEGLSSNLTPPTLAGATDGLFFTDSASSKLSSTDVVIDFVQQQNAGPASMADNAAVSGQELPQSDIVESDYFICSGCDSVFDSLAVAQAHLLLGKCSSPDTAAPTGGVPHKPQSQSGSTEVSATSESLLFEAGAAEESSTLSAARETEALCPQSVPDNADCQRLQEVTVLDNAEHQSQSSQEVGAGVASLVLPSCVQIRTSDPSVLQEIVYTTTTPTEVDRLENSGLASDEQVKMSRAEILSSRSPSTGSGQVFQVSSDGAEQIQEVYVLPGESQEGIMELVKKFAQQEGVGTMQIVIQDLPHG